MGILDDAIKEHLELKRSHGADAAELKQLEDEAFGAAERPGDEGSSPDPAAEAPTEFMTQPDLEPEADAAEAPPPESAEEEAPAMEHETVAEPDPAVKPSGPSTEEREAIAEQPTEMYDIEEELGASQAEAPSEEDLIEEEIDEPRLAPVDPLAGFDDEADAPVVHAADDDEDDDFWDEKRLSDELDQALEAPSEPEPEEPAPAEPAPEPAEPEDRRAAEEPADTPDEDVLEETPDFLEEAPEDDQLWFEQKPPKDFDFDD
ncbi:MAG: hypothetical protein WDZ46_10105 [Solirubrobacterales bacterium]